LSLRASCVNFRVQAFFWLSLALKERKCVSLSI